MDGAPRPGLVDRIDGWFRGRVWLVDACLAVALAAVVAPSSVQLALDAGLGTTWTWALLGAVVVLHVAVAARRRAPVPAFAVVAGAELVLALSPLLTDPAGSAYSAVLLPSSLGYLVVAYTVSAHTDPPWPTLSLVVGGLGAVVAAVRCVTAGTGLGAADLLLLLGLSFATVLAAWALGRFRRLRIEQVAALAERARAAEADREERDRRAAAEERARIARELHDVVAHHVSVMGVQASAARRVLDRDPEAARAALGAVEGASREAVGQMRELLGTLRSGELAADGTPPGEDPGRAPQPTLADLPALVERAATPVCAITCDVVEAEPGLAASVPPPVQLSAYRIVQESLANVHRHSTASRASVVVRVDRHRLEVEVVDNGRPRRGTSGTGLGHLGIRERAHHLGGAAEIGPRHDGAGYRVRVRFPVEPAAELARPVEAMA